MESLSSFFDMGGHGAFIWPCFGVTALVMIVLLVVSMRNLRAKENMLRILQETTDAKAPKSSTRPAEMPREA